MVIGAGSLEECWSSVRFRAVMGSPIHVCGPRSSVSLASNSPLRLSLWLSLARPIGTIIRSREAAFELCILPPSTQLPSQPSSISLEPSTVPLNTLNISATTAASTVTAGCRLELRCGDVVRSAAAPLLAIGASSFLRGHAAPLSLVFGRRTISLVVCDQQLLQVPRQDSETGDCSTPSNCDSNDHCPDHDIQDDAHDAMGDNWKSGDGDEVGFEVGEELGGIVTRFFMLKQGLPTVRIRCLNGQMHVHVKMAHLDDQNASPGTSQRIQGQLFAWMPSVLIVVIIAILLSIFFTPEQSRNPSLQLITRIGQTLSELKQLDPQIESRAQQWIERCLENMGGSVL